MRSKKFLKGAAILALVSYLVFNAIVLIIDFRYNNELNKYDLNKDGFFNGNERTAAQQIAQEKVVNDTGRNLAPLTLIPISIIIGGIYYFGRNKYSS